MGQGIGEEQCLGYDGPALRQRSQSRFHHGRPGRTLGHRRMPQGRQRVAHETLADGFE